MNDESLESPERATGFGAHLDAARADRRADLFGGSGAVGVWSLLGGAAPPFSAVLACELAPGGDVGTHTQQRDPEIVVCLAGRGTATVAGEPQPMRPGTVAYVAFGSTLALRNESADEPLRYLIVKATTPR
jgi:quercetin dioxygenase-like cupin family protein